MTMLRVPLSRPRNGPSVGLCLVSSKSVCGVHMHNGIRLGPGAGLGPWKSRGQRREGQILISFTLSE